MYGPVKRLQMSMSIGLYWEKLRCKHWRVPVISLHERYHDTFLYSGLMDNLIKGEVVSEAFCVMIKGALSAQAPELVEKTWTNWPNFFKFSWRFWKAVFICLNLSHRLIVCAVFYYEPFYDDYRRPFLRYFSNCWPLEFFKWNYSVILSAAVVLAAAERKSTTATPQGVLES